MTVEAQIVGGPHDGEWIELEERSMWAEVLVPVPLEPMKDDRIGPSYKVVRIMATLTRDGWRLYWPREVHREC